jgi:uncharacterized protein YoxC
MLQDDCQAYWNIHNSRNHGQQPFDATADSDKSAISHSASEIQAKSTWSTAEKDTLVEIVRAQLTTIAGPNHGTKAFWTLAAEQLLRQHGTSRSWEACRRHWNTEIELSYAERSPSPKSSSFDMPLPASDRNISLNERNVRDVFNASSRFCTTQQSGFEDHSEHTAKKPRLDTIAHENVSGPGASSQSAPNSAKPASGEQPGSSVDKEIESKPRIIPDQISAISTATAMSEGSSGQQTFNEVHGLGLPGRDHKSFYTERIQYFERENKSLAAEKESRIKTMSTLEEQIRDTKEGASRIWKHYDKLIEDLKEQRQAELRVVHEKEEKYRMSVQDEHEVMKKLDSRITKNAKLRKHHQDILSSLEDDTEEYSIIQES